MDKLTLVAAFRRYEYNDALFDEQEHEGLRLKIGHYEGALLNAMRAMLRHQAYDVCEMSPSSYLIARQSGAPLVGLPVFPFSEYPLGQIVVRNDSSLTKLEDLSRARIAVRTWAQPTALWTRNYLTDYLGIDLNSVCWLFISEDPVAGLRRPEGSIECRGKTLEGLLESGEADAVIGLHEVPPNCRRLIADPEGAATQWTRDTGVVPANHLLVMNAKYAGTSAPAQVCKRVDSVRKEYLNTGMQVPGVISKLKRINPQLEPLPSGRTANALMWQTLIASMVRQGMLEPVANPLDLLVDWEHQ